MKEFNFDGFLRSGVLKVNRFQLQAAAQGSRSASNGDKWLGSV